MYFYYIAGPMTGYPGLNRPAAIALAIKLQKQGHAVFIPHIMPEIPGFKLNDYLTLDYYIISKCDRVIMMTNWSESEGAMKEYQYARLLGKVIVYE